MNPGRAYNEGYISRDHFIAIGMQSAQRKLRVQHEIEEAERMLDEARKPKET